MASMRTHPCHSGASRSEEPGTHDWARPSKRMITSFHPVVGSGFVPAARPGMTKGEAVA
jgi:hypothetical protein